MDRPQYVYGKSLVRIDDEEMPDRKDTARTSAFRHRSGGRRLPLG